MRRREFIAGLGGTAIVGPRGARGQQAAMPVVGFIRSSTEAGFGHLTAAFREGLHEAGYVEGRNVTIEFRWSGDQLDRLPLLAAEMVSRQVAGIVTNYGSMAAVVAATKTIPIIFISGEDPVTGGLVANLYRPGGNVTGVTFSDIPLSGKRLGLLHELTPKTKRIALLLDPRQADAEVRELETAALATGRPILVVKAATGAEIDGAFSSIAHSSAGAMLVGGGAFFTRQRRQLVELVGRLAIPAIYVQREFVVAGGLMSYGASQTDAYRRGGGYVSRILKGDKPAEMPVELPTKFHMAINLKTAKTLGLDVPLHIQQIADEVLE